MGDLADVFEEERKSLSELVAGLSDDDAKKPVPATQGWRIRDIVAHLAGDAACVIVADFPSVFLQSFGDEAAIESLNEWTAKQVAQREGMPVSEILAEWESSASTVVKMMRGSLPWPEGIPPFADRVLITDLGVHKQDIHGALGIVRDRDSAPIKIGVSGYVVLLDMSLRSAGGPALEIQADEKNWIVGGDDPGATLTCSRFELFRALSGRRNPDQVRAYGWDGDPEPFMHYFYPYGVRAEALVE